MKSEKIFVGLSGGVDSAVSALRLKRDGHTVVGVFIRTWHPDFIACNEEAERLDAMRIAAHLDIPFLTFDAVEDYKQNVADYMIREYAAGRTPNPDVMCNRYVKFGSFLAWARRNGADAIATGHYARITVRDGKRILCRGTDTSKDQSYFLWQLTEDDLSRIRFPIGDSLKSRIRTEAFDAGIPVFDKRDSQGICFLGQIDLHEFLRQYIDCVPGAVLDENGRVVGKHNGAILYTIGERHGFTFHASKLAHSAHYVIARDIDANTITVATSPRRMNRDENHIRLSDTLVRTKDFSSLTAQFRYRQQPHNVVFEFEDSGYGMLTVLDESVEMPSAGQSCVLYRNDECVGGGIII